MDFLASLNVEDLPEQQTRIQPLFRSASSDHDSNQKIGFDSCCTCGKASTKVECQSCHRVLYCSNECRRKDSIPSTNLSSDFDEVGAEQALGHTSVICALLCLCSDDEVVEGDDEKELSDLTIERRNVAADRVASEFESFPSTLANIIMEGPCYQTTLQKASRSTLTIHVIGSSKYSELWEGHPDVMQQRNVFSCYADALAEIAENYKMDSILLQFIGPECPEKNIDKIIDIPPILQSQKNESLTKLQVMTFNTEYDGSVRNGSDRFSPDILVFFNPGFTCPDYAWEKTLASCMKNKQLPFLVTTNTEMEAIADMQHLFDHKLFQDISPTLQSILQDDDDVYNYGDEDNIGENDNDGIGDINSFFSLNPYCGLRVRQSGTMANDLFVKSRWIFGGYSGPLSRVALSNSLSTEPLSSTRKRRRVKGEEANNKKLNPALV
mmetsp:Transcript_27325/g.31414  ORF Transcript_27325/g.31414 Transcript_27325/m.31414 type:complete len:438 (-) Transcript_27325:10-1323(-)